jgi:hypothetical protein
MAQAAGRGVGPRLRAMNEQVAAHVTTLTTSMWFLYGLLVFVALWMRFAPPLHLDTAPAYPVMLYWVNLFQALMLPVLAVGQSVLSRASERRQIHEAEVVDRLEELTQRILAMEEEMATARHARGAHHEELLAHLAELRTGLAPGGAAPAPRPQ